jgi:radical SAM superfamily enzyme YgiQ (UPF0313 family)
VIAGASRSLDLIRPLSVVLISTYELGRQPFGLASPAAWLRQAGATVTCTDLARQSLDEAAIVAADLVAIYVPMHTATRIAAKLVDRLRALNPRAHLCFYGLYAPVNAVFLRKLGADTILGGEFEEGLVALSRRLAEGDISPTARAALHDPAIQREPLISLARQRFVVPDRSDLPDLSSYAHLILSNCERRTVGYTETTRGCKNTCRHCPIVPIYDGVFRIIQRDVVLEDVSRQVEVGARHITFGDPDFFNGPGHALPIVTALHQRWPDLTYDVTIKVEHLLRHAQHLPMLRDTNCLFVTSAVESVDNAVLEMFDKRHTREDFVHATALLRDAGLVLNPTFVTFTPWTSLAGYLDLLQTIADLDLVEHVAPIQYAIRLLVPHGSKLMDLPVVNELVAEFDEEQLVYPWAHPDPRVDLLYADVLDVVKASQAERLSRAKTFDRIWDTAQAALVQHAVPARRARDVHHVSERGPLPHLSEAWFC